MIELVDREPILPEGLVRVILESAEASFCPPGLAFRAALPPGTAPRVGHRIGLRPAGSQALERGEVPSHWRAGLQALAEPQSLERLAANHPEVAASIAQLERLGWIDSAEVTERSRVQARTEPIYALAPGIELAAWQERLRRAPRQRELLEQIALSGPLGLPAEPALRALVRAGAVQRELQEQWRTPETTPVEAHASAPPPELTPEQREAVDASRRRSRRAARRALPAPRRHRQRQDRGLPARDRARALARGRGALVLVPEIALTPQLVGRFRARFGDARRRAALRARRRASASPSGAASARRGAASCVGARSAVFAPVRASASSSSTRSTTPPTSSEDGSATTRATSPCWRAGGRGARWCSARRHAVARDARAGRARASCAR